MIERPVGTLDTVVRLLRGILAGYVRTLPTYPALLGDGHGTIKVAGWPGWVWVRVGSDERLERAFNQRVPLRDGRAIIVGYDTLQPTLFQVLSLRDDAYAGGGTGGKVEPQVVAHHETHEFPIVDDDALDGSDTTYIHWRQMRGLRVYIVSGFTVGIERWPIRRGDTNIWIATQQIDLELDRPVSGARYVTMYLDADGVFQRRLGSTVPTASITIADAPLCVAGEWELANVLLWTAQAELKDDGDRQDIVDRRFPAAFAAAGIIAADVEIEEIGTATYDDLQDVLNLTQSAGYMEGGLLTAHAADAITGVNGAGGGAGAGEFEVAGDQTAGFGAAVVITVSGSTGNDGNYTISAGGATHATGTTTIPVDEAVPDATVDGDVDALGTLDISAVRGFIKTTDSEIGVTKSFDLVAITNFVLTDALTNYVYVDHNVGSPQFAKTTTRSDVEMNRQFTLGRVYRDGLTLHIIQSGVQLANFLREQHEYAIAIHGFARASGGDISESGNRFIASDAGVFYLGRNKAITTGRDTNNGDTFTRHFHAAGPVWTSDVVSQICAAAYQYDDGVSLQNFTKYGTFWVFIHFDGDLHVVVGRDDYTLAEAQAATVPSLPNTVSDFSTLAAKIIIKFNGTNFYAIQSAYKVVFPLSGGLDHNDLGAIQGGAADEYYHMTAAQHTPVRGDIYYGDATPAMARLPIGTASFILRSDGTDPSWVNPALHVPLPPVAEGDIIYAGPAPSWARLARGAAGTVLQMGAFQIPGWVATTNIPVAPGGEGHCLISNGVPVWESTATPVWLGTHYFEAGIDIAAAQGIDMGDAAWIGIAGNEILTFNAGGNVTFSAEVESVIVAGGTWVGADANCSWVFDSANSDISTLDPVAIGHTAPTAYLHIEPSGTAIIDAFRLAGTYNQSYVVNIIPTITYVAANPIAMALSPVFDLDTNVTHTYGQLNVSDFAGTANVTNTAIAALYRTRLLAAFSGTITLVNVLQVEAKNNSTSGGTITNARGLHIGALAGEVTGTAHAIYQQGASDLNYLAGNVGIGTATIPHGRVGWAKLAIDGTVNSSAGPHIQCTVSTDSHPTFQVLNYAHDNIHLAFDAYFDGNWKSSDPGSSFAIVKRIDRLIIRYDIAAAGGTVTWNDGIVLNTSGDVKIPALAGAGVRAVVAAADGTLSAP